MYKTLLAILAALFTCVVSASAGTPARLVSATWAGNDFVISFSDSVSYATDLAASDSNELVIHVPAVTADSSVNATSGNKSAVIAVSPATGLHLSIVGQGRFGYSTEWKPYTHRLIIHTFDWSKLGYGESQFHKGLLALEENMPAVAEELLGLASATGENRATSALGVYYVQHGNDSIARHYLQSPSDADAFAALAVLQRHTGDSALAQQSDESFRQMQSQAAAGTRDSSLSQTPDNTQVQPRAHNLESNPALARSLRHIDRWVLLGGGIVLLMILASLLYLAVRRGRPTEPLRTITQEVPPAKIVEPVPVAVQTPEPAAFPSPIVYQEPEAVHTENKPSVSTTPSPTLAEQVVVESQSLSEQSSVAVTAAHPRSTSQADEIRRNLESRTSESEVHTAATINEARSKGVSRDNVDLRKRMQAARNVETRIPD